MKPTITINEYPIGWEWLDRVPLEDFNWLIEIFHSKSRDHYLGLTEGFCEEMNVVYRTEELNTYLRYPKQEINPWYKHSTHIRLKLRDILQIPLTDITIIDIISLP